MKSFGKFNQKSISLGVRSMVIAGVGIAGSSTVLGQVALEEIVVTAQKRAQSIQDVPVAVTAFTEDMLKTNRITTVNDIGSLAPNTSVRPTAGGGQSPEFTLRGRVSSASAAGTDPSVSMYLDGVYIGSTRGSIFELPDIAQLEVLRGPQGTLFGRNATAGAISISTRDPSGEFGVEQDIGMGNRDYFTTRTTIDFPAWGPLSAYVSYRQEKQDGYVENLGAGTVWDRTHYNYGIDSSPKDMGEKNTESFFLAATYEPSDQIKLTYKYDYATDKGVPDATATVSTLGLDSLFGAAVNGGDVAASVLYPSSSRPDKVYNAFALARDHTIQGHNLTTNWEINEQIVLKNILAYRKGETFSAMDIGGLSGLNLVLPAEYLGGTPGQYQSMLYCLFCATNYEDVDQWSDEIQINYESDALTLTAGGLYFDMDQVQGAVDNAASSQPNGYYFLGSNGFVVPAAGEVVTPGLFNPPTYQSIVAQQTTSYVRNKSYALYAQGEFHITPRLDLIAGYRVTRDDKTTANLLGNNYYESEYKDTKGSYLAGINYKLSDDMLLYAKYSTAFVSGGSIGGLEFDPEEALSTELGLKADFLSSRLRTNLALFDVTYEDPQLPQSGALVAAGTGNPEYANFGLLVIPFGGDIEVQGAELEITALPMEGLTLRANMGYVDQKYTSYSPLLLASVGGATYGGTFVPARSPEMTANLGINYETAPLFEDAYMIFSVSGNWRDKYRLDQNPARAAAVPQYGVVEYSPEGWVVNARVSLAGLQLWGAEGEIALWGRNLTDYDKPIYSLNLVAMTTANYMEERSYGLDVKFKF